jgi:hypothetical protein
VMTGYSMLVKSMSLAYGRLAKTKRGNRLCNKSVTAGPGMSMKDTTKLKINFKSR